MNKEELLLDERQGYRSFAVAHNALVDIVYELVKTNCDLSTEIKKLKEQSEVKINEIITKHNLVVDKHNILVEEVHCAEKEIIKLEQPDKRPDVTMPKAKSRGKKRKVRSDKGRVRDINGKWNTAAK